MLFTFNEFITARNSIMESQEKTAVIAFGRFNPPTLGHLKVINAVKSHAESCSGVPMIFLSHSEDQEKNPLSYDDKYNYLTLSAPSGVKVVKSESKTIYQVLGFLSSTGFKKVVFVAGDDRIDGFQSLKKLKERFNFNDIEVVSSGNRGIGSLDNVENVSSSALRKLALDGNKNDFIKYSALFNNLPKAEEMYGKVRLGMGLDV